MRKFKPKKNLLSRYGFKLINNDYYNTIILSGIESSNEIYIESTKELIFEILSPCLYGEKYLDKGNFLFRKGVTFLEAGYIYSPYIPMQDMRQYHLF